MTPKEKAEQLFQLYLPYVESSNYVQEIKNRCKQCALIAVDEMLVYFSWEKSAMKFWKEVKEEIEKL